MLQDVLGIFLLFVIVGFVWRYAEKQIYGTKTSRKIDDVICAILSISLYYNIF